MNLSLAQDISNPFWRKEKNTLIPKIDRGSGWDTLFTFSFRSLFMICCTPRLFRHLKNVWLWHEMTFSKKSRSFRVLVKILYFTNKTRVSWFGLNFILFASNTT